MSQQVYAPALNDLGSQGAGTSVPDLTKGLYFRIACTAATRTIGAPIAGSYRDPQTAANMTSPPGAMLAVGTVVFFEVKNTSGGALTVTWDAIFKGAPGNPATANRRVHQFVWDGSAFVLTNGAADVAN